MQRFLEFNQPGDDMQFYRRNCDWWRTRVAPLTPEERGIFDTIIDVLVSYEDQLPPDCDDRWWARECNCNPRTWRAVRDRLIARGRLSYKPDGTLASNTAEEVLKEARKFSERQSKRGRKGAERRWNGDENPNENNGRGMANTLHNTTLHNTTQHIEETSAADAASVASLEFEKEFEEFWEVYPKRLGPNPKAPARKSFLRFCKSGVDPALIIAGARACAAKERDKVGTPYIPQAVTWLNQQRWDDYAASGPNL
jgi:hypothetical protein